MRGAQLVGSGRRRSRRQQRKDEGERRALHGSVPRTSSPDSENRPNTSSSSATTSIKRSDFGVSAYVPAISDNVSLTIDVEFKAVP